MRLLLGCRAPTRSLTLAGTRHFVILHGTGGEGGDVTPRDWLLSKLELRFKNQCVACHERKPVTPEFNVLGQPVASEVRSMTKNGQNATSPITSHLSKLEPRFKDQNVPYGLRNIMRYLLDPYRLFKGSKFKKS